MNKLFFLFLYFNYTVVFSQTLNYRFKNLNKTPVKIEAYTLAGKNIGRSNTNVKHRKHIYYLNKKGNFLRQENYKKNGDLSNWLIYKYDKDDNLVKVIYRYGDSTLNYINNYEFDSIGRLSKSITYTNSDTLITDYSYLKKGKLLIRSKVIRKSGDSSLVYMDDKGNELKSVYTRNGIRNGHVDRIYEKKNNLIYVENVDKTGATSSSIEFTYDDYGNFLTKKYYTFYNGIKTLESEIVRDIEYDKYNNPLNKYERNLSTDYVYIEIFKYFY